MPIWSVIPRILGGRFAREVAVGCREEAVLLCFDALDFRDDLLGLGDGKSRDCDTLRSAVASATFFRGEVGLSFSTGGGATSFESEEMKEERGVNNLDARGVDVEPLPAADFVMVSEDAVRLSIGTMRTVAIEESLG